MTPAAYPQQLAQVECLVGGVVEIPCSGYQPVGSHRDRIEPVDCSEHLDTAGHTDIRPVDLDPDIGNFVMWQAVSVRCRIRRNSHFHCKISHRLARVSPFREPVSSRYQTQIRRWYRDSLAWLDWACNHKFSLAGFHFHSAKCGAYAVKIGKSGNSLSPDNLFVHRFVNFRTEPKSNFRSATFGFSLARSPSAHLAAQMRSSSSHPAEARMIESNAIVALCLFAAFLLVGLLFLVVTP